MDHEDDSNYDEDIIELELEVSDGVFKSFKVVVGLSYEDDHYGSDIDGNRGLAQRFIKGFEIQQVLDTETGIDVTAQMKDNAKLIEAVGKEVI